MTSIKTTFDLENNAITPTHSITLSDTNTINELVADPWPQFQKLSKLSLQTAASYTFCLEMVALVYLLSQVSKDEDNLAAIALITTLINSLICVSIAPLLAMSLVAGKSLGEFNDAKANRESEEQLLLRKQHIAAMLRNGLVIATAMSLLAALPMVFSKDLLVELFKQKPEVAQITQDFVRPYAIAVPAIMTRICTSQVMFTFERTKPAMIIGLGSLIIGMAIGSIYAYGFLNAPKLGNNGILIGAILNEYLTAIIYSVYIAKSPRLKEFDFYNFSRPWQPHLGQLYDIWAQGRPFILTMASETTMQFMLSSYAGLVGVKQQAAIAAIVQLSTFSFLLQLAFGQSAARDISRTMGEGKFKNASQSGKLSLLALIIFTTPALLLFSAYPEALADMQGNHDQEYRRFLINLARILLPGCYLDMLRCMFLEQLRPLGDARKSSLISSTSVFVGIILSGVLSLHTSLEVYGDAIGYTTSSGLAASILAFRWLNKIQPKTIEHTAKHPEQFPSLVQWCRLFSERNPTNSSTRDNEIEMTINPMSELKQ